MVRSYHAISKTILTPLNPIIGLSYASRCDAASKAYRDAQYWSVVTWSSKKVLSTLLKLTDTQYEQTFDKKPSTFSWTTVTEIVTGQSTSSVFNIPSPICSFATRDCNSLWNDFGRTWTSLFDESPNTLTMFLPDPPNSMVINGITTILATGSLTQAPTLTINGRTYPPALDSESTWYALDGPFLNGISLGMTKTWVQTVRIPYKPLCTPNFELGSGTGCRISAWEVELIYSPVTGSRNMNAKSPVEGPITSFPIDLRSSKYTPTFRTNLFGNFYSNISRFNQRA